jgi:Leucine-rich repeat (LRR) protein/energy-coupling factor transporter ATP-binding protein EcfA2
MKAETTNPYVGLRPFDVDESLLFFGRNDQTLELLQRLHQHHFVAVVGSSGCGKSSLLRAGLIPALKAGYLVDDSDNWFIAIMKPGQNPLYNLAESILLQINPQTDSVAVSALVQKIEEEGADVIINLISAIQKEKNINFFLLVDQFEELFRFAMDQKDVSKKDEAIDFVNIMLELSQQSVISFYVVITMRSDFIGDCSQFYGLPEAMNKSQYLVPRLNRVQLKMVIEGPAKLYGGKLDSALTSLLLNELGKVKDELPLLQHALMRIWDYEERINKSGALDLEDYSKIGGIEKALSFHADEALAVMNKEELEIAKQLFKALTAIDENGRKIRRPVLFSQLNDLTDGTEEQLRHIIDMFIKDKRSFLIINKTGDSGDEIIDISHESLIRQWDTLCKWVEEEGESASVYLQLIEASKLNKKGKKDFLTGSELQLSLDWRKKFKPSAIWANRYKEGFEECMAYLNASEAERTRLNNIEIKRKRTKRKLVLSIMGILLFSAIGGLILYGNAIISEEKAKEALTKSEKLIEAFYFYDDKFALAFNKYKEFYFIDKEGNSIEKLKKWKKAEQFDDYGYAKVRDENEIDYMLDTSGNSYKAAYSAWEIDSSIRAVDLSYQIYDKLLPSELFKAKELHFLYSHSNSLESLPRNIGDLKNLIFLDLSFNSFSIFPKEIGELTKLTWLGLEGNLLTSLPKEIGELKNLLTLYLANNKLTNLPANIGELEKLTMLDLRGNQLVGLPNEIGKLENLNYLYLGYNLLQSLIPEIGELKYLYILDLSNNQLTSLPQEIGSFEYLYYLDLSNNQLTSLPNEIGELLYLSTLNLSGNQLTNFPKEIGEFVYLYSLDLSGNQLTSLPDEIGKLQYLYSLNLTGNNISKTEIEKIRRLLPNCEIITENSYDSESYSQ